MSPCMGRRRETRKGTKEEREEGTMSRKCSQKLVINYYSRNTLTITLAAEDSFMIISCLSPLVALRYCKTGALLGDFERSEVTKAHSVLSRNEKAVNFREKEGVSR